MRHILVRASVLLSVVCGAGLAWAFSAGPPASRTGAPAVAARPAEPNCTMCHTGSPVNDPSGSLRIIGVPIHYVPGQTYPITIRIQHAWAPLPPDTINWGFQIQTVQKTTGDSIGSWQFGSNAPPDTFRIRTGTGSYLRRRYIEHARNPVAPNYLSLMGSLRHGQIGGTEWTINWKAPPADSGMIYFFAAGNSANGDFISIGSGDFIFTTVESTTVQGTVDVPPHSPPITLVTGIDEPYPNPMRVCTNIDFHLARAGNVDLAIFDLQGRRVRTLATGYRPVGTHASTWDGRREGGIWARNGVYFLRLTAPDLRVPFTRKIVLSR